MQDLFLPRWAAIGLATLAAIIGLASSAVTARFFILGLQHTEADTTAQNALVAAGLLMIAAEVAAFFIAALLPKGHGLRPMLLWAGFVLVAFEVLTVFATQHALVQTGQALQAGQQTRIQHLQASIASTQNQAAQLVATAQEQVGSRFMQQRQDGQQTLQTAHSLQQQAHQQAQELATLLAAQRPTLADTFGQGGMVAYTVARALLMTITGLVMMSAAGALLRSAAPVGQPVLRHAPLPTVTVAPASSAWRAAVPAVLVSAAPVAWPMPAISVSAASAPAVPVPRAAQGGTVVAQPPNAVPAPDAGPRYQAARAAVMDGSLPNPSVRAIQSLVGDNTSAARAIQACLQAEGLIERHGQGYRLAQSKQEILL